MGLVRVQGPQEPVCDTDYVKLFIHVDTAADDERIRSLSAAAEARLDGADGLLGRALMRQTWLLSLPDWPPSGYCLPLPPLIDVTGITYLDTNGDEQTLATSYYRTVNRGSRPSELVYAFGVTLPTVQSEQPDAVRITFDAGYLDLDSPTNNPVPEPIRQAIVMTVQSWYDFPGREDVPEVVASLISPFKVNRLGR